MHGPVPCEFVLEDPDASANIQVREVCRAPFPHGCPHGVQQPACGAARAALAVGVQVLACPPGVEHAVEVLTLTARHGWSLPLNTGGCRRASPGGSAAQPRGDVARDQSSRICAGFPRGVQSRANWPLCLASSSDPRITPVLSPRAENSWRVEQIIAAFITSDHLSGASPPI